MFVVDQRGRHVILPGVRLERGEIDKDERLLCTKCSGVPSEGMEFRRM